MKKLMYGALFLAVVGIGFFSCEKEEVIEMKSTSNEIVENKNQNLLTTRSVNSGTLLSSSELEFIGNYHNTSLELIFTNFNWEYSDYKQELITQLINNEIDLNSYENNYLINRCEPDLNSNLNALQNELSVVAFNYIQNAVTMSSEITNVNTFQNTLNQMQIDAKNTITDICELNAVLTSLEIFKSSASFWAPANIGGNGIGYSYWIILNDNQPGVDWRRVLTADGVSGGIGMLGVAVAGMCGPVGWVALAIVGGESALSSGSSLLF